MSTLALGLSLLGIIGIGLGIIGWAVGATEHDDD